MNMIVTIIRFPIAVIGTALLLGILWPFEIVLGLVCLLPFSISDSREELKRRFMIWPFNTFTNVQNIWLWMFADPEPADNDSSWGIGKFVANMFLPVQK